MSQSSSSCSLLSEDMMRNAGIHQWLGVWETWVVVECGLVVGEVFTVVGLLGVAKAGLGVEMDLVGVDTDRAGGSHPHPLPSSRYSGRNA